MKNSKNKVLTILSDIKSDSFDRMGAAYLRHIYDNIAELKSAKSNEIAEIKETLKSTNTQTCFEQVSEDILDIGFYEESDAQQMAQFFSFCSDNLGINPFSPKLQEHLLLTVNNTVFGYHRSDRQVVNFFNSLSQIDSKTRPQLSQELVSFCVKILLQKFRSNSSYYSIGAVDILLSKSSSVNSSDKTKHMVTQSIEGAMKEHDEFYLDFPLEAIKYLSESGVEIFEAKQHPLWNCIEQLFAQDEKKTNELNTNLMLRYSIDWSSKYSVSQEQITKRMEFLIKYLKNDLYSDEQKITVLTSILDSEVSCITANYKSFFQDVQGIQKSVLHFSDLIDACLQGLEKKPIIIDWLSNYCDLVPSRVGDKVSGEQFLPIFEKIKLTFFISAQKKEHGRATFKV